MVSNNNSVDVLKEALKAKPDMLGVNEDEANQAMIDEGFEDDYYGYGDNNDDNEIVCPLCDAHFQSQEELITTVTKYPVCRVLFVVLTFLIRSRWNCTLTMLTKTE